MDHVESFGQWLRQHRRSRDLTQDDLAYRLNCSVETVRRIELGTRRPSKQMAELLAQFFCPTPEEQAEVVRFARLGTTGPLETTATGAPFAQARSAPPPEAEPDGEDTVVSRANLPMPLTPLIGRGAAVTVVADYMLSDHVRLLTLTGPPGIGKTRIALAAAERLVAPFSSEVYFISLVAITDPELVISALGKSVGVAQIAGRPILETLKRHLQDKPRLFVLDNFEHVVEAASVVAELLHACPLVKVVVTSREALHVRGERQYAVLPLEMPVDTLSIPFEALSKCSSVELFVERAQAADPSFKLTEENGPDVAAICARLDGLPLAIELAAARANLFMPHEMLDRLESRLPLLNKGPRDLPLRHQTLQAAIGWSYHLLSPEEQKLFSRLSVFAGGWTLQAVEGVCNGMADLGLDPLDGIASLLEKSLIMHQDREKYNGSRFTMLETVRSYALEQLEESGEAETVRSLHAAYFTGMIEAADPELDGKEQARLLTQLDSDHDNLRAVLAWVVGDGRQAPHGSAEMGLRLVGAMGRFWGTRDHLAEGRGWLVRALARPTGVQPTAERASALRAVALLADNQGDYDAVRTYCTEYLDIKWALGDSTATSSAYILMAKGATGQKDYPEAQRLLEQGLQAAMAAEDERAIAFTRNGLGELARLQGDYEEAKKHYEYCLHSFTQSGNTGGIGFSLHNLAYVAQHEGNFERSAAMLDESLRLFRQLNNRMGIAMCLSALAGVMRGRGRPEDAARLLGATDTLLQSIGALLDPADQAEYDLNRRLVLDKVGPAAYDAANAEGRAMPLELAFMLALAEAPAPV